jgi:hypothetical protein
VPLTDQEKRTYARLRKVRASETVTFKPCGLMREQIETDGKLQPLSIRRYQTKGIIHLLYQPRMVLGDATGLGKTIQAIAWAAYILEKKPHTRFLVVTQTSALYQWADELRKFTRSLRGTVVRSQAMFYCTVCRDNFPRSERAAHHHDKYRPRCADCGKNYHEPTYGELHNEDWSNPHKKCGQWEWDEETGLWSGQPIRLKTKEKDGVITIPEYKDWRHCEEFVSRKPVYDEFFAGGDDGPQFLIMNYHTLVADWTDLLKRPLEGVPFNVVFDECQAFKNPTTTTHKKCKDVGRHANRVVGLSATILKNCLLDGYGIYKVVVPKLFTSKTKFMDRFCTTEMQTVYVQGKRRQVPIITGYKNLRRFKALIDPFYLGRAKHEVTDELPTLTTMLQHVEMTAAEKRLYREIRRGQLELHGQDVEVSHLTALIRFQQAVDSMHVLGHPGVSAKETELLRLLDEQLDGKVIVFSRFAKVALRLQQLVEEAGVRTTIIHGGITKGEVREANKQLFQDPHSGVDVIFITTAGSSAINLQSAATMVFYDSPWSWGDYLQLLGRMIRIGSEHARVVALHLVAVMDLESINDEERDPTIDEHVLNILTPKKGLFEAVLGKAELGALEFVDSEEGSLRDLYNAVLGL